MKYWLCKRILPMIAFNIIEINKGALIYELKANLWQGGMWQEPFLYAGDSKTIGS